MFLHGFDLQFFPRKNVNMVIPIILVRKEEMLWCLGMASISAQYLKHLIFILLSTEGSCSVSALEICRKDTAKEYRRTEKSGIEEVVRCHAVVSV